MRRWPRNRSTGWSAKAAAQPLHAPAPRPTAAPRPCPCCPLAAGRRCHRRRHGSCRQPQPPWRNCKAALEAFDGCALKRTATNTVFADGVAEGRVMLIGEAPGRDEDRIGKPFVGRAGQLLDKMLAQHRAGPARPTPTSPMSSTGGRRTIAIPRRRKRPPACPSCAGISNWPIRQVIILLGAVAARHVVGITDGIMKLRGRWMEYRVGDRMVPLMPTLHPAYLLRQPAHKKLAWRDLQAVRRQNAGSLG